MQSRRLRLAFTLTSVVILLAILAGTVLLLDRLHDTAQATAAQLVQRAARQAESTVNRQFLAIDGVLAGLPAILSQIAGNGPLEPQAANRMLRNIKFQNLNFRDLIILHPDGHPWASALAASRSQPPPVEPERVAEAWQRGAAVISGPARNPLTGEWTLFFLRAIDLPGTGAVLAVADVPVSLITTLLAPIGEGSGLRISVERADAQLLASLPHDETRIGRTLSRSATTMPQEPGPEAVPSRFGDTPVYASARPTLYRDVMAVASQQVEAALASYAQDRWRLMVVALSSAVIVVAVGFARSAAMRQRERIEAERATAQSVLESAIETMPDSFVMFDAEDKLMVCNQRYRDFYAVSAPFIVPGARFDDIMREGAQRGQYPQVGDGVEAFVAETSAWHRGDFPSRERLLPDGRWILSTERRTPYGGTVGIRTDITALKHAMADLAQARDTAAAATEAKSRFLAHMSHELRTPLNGVLGLAQVLARDPALSGEQRTRAETLEAAGRHLVAVANDVLDLAKVEAGQLELRTAAINLADLLRGCATLVRPAAEEKFVSVALDFTPGLPETVELDQTRMRQLLLNLLSNAVKFTPAGGRVELAARTLAQVQADGTQLVRIEVRDTGPGVPAEQRAAVFGDFVQLDHGMAGGTGLGLAIAAGIAVQMGGRIGCDAHTASATGQGAIFWVELPLQPVAAPTEPARPPTAPHRSLHVLVADDVPANLGVARALLESTGHRVHCVADGGLAVKAVADPPGGRPFDLVLMDVMMPGTDGLEATRQIRAMTGTVATVPILAVTASTFAEDIAACHAAGMDAHLAKPIELEVLAAALVQLTSDGCALPLVATPPSQPSELPLLDRPASALLVVPGLDPVAALSLTREFIREMLEATEHLRAADPSAVDRMVTAAHRLAGAAATLGAARLAAVAQKFQREAKHVLPEAVIRLQHGVLSAADETLTALGAGAAATSSGASIDLAGA